MTERILETQDDLELWITFLRTKKLPLTVTEADGRDRSSSQNRLMWRWAGEAAFQRGDMTPDEVQREWKLRYGVPILRDEDPIFREFYDEHLKKLNYPQKIEAMRFIPVTSELRMKQMVKFMDTVQRECLEQGIKLTDPDPDLAKYQARYRDRDGAEGGDAKAAPVPQDRQARAESIAQTPNQGQSHDHP